MSRLKRIVEALLLLGIVILLFLTGQKWFETDRSGNIHELSGTVLSVDNSEIFQAGAGTVGNQTVLVIVNEGHWKGEQVTAVNHLNGQMDMDELYQPGDTILLAIQVKDQQITHAKAINTFRQNWELVLFILFAVALIAYSRIIGLKALFSFVASLGLLWCYYIPNLLNGADPLPLSLSVLVLLSMVIILTVAGATRHGIAAFLGTISGLAVTLILTLFFGDKLNLGGMTTPFSTTLLVQGNYGLNMQHIFYSAVLLGASGAAMDIAMDVSVSMNEIKLKRPDITMRELIQSGFNVGRMVIGTMATTLLLAYSGGYLTMLMVFVSQGTSFTRIVNMKLVAAEIFRILIGSIGLLMVAPVTALIAGVLLTAYVETSPPAKDYLETN
ncbi:YibE/F family protein [Halodesulfovibrio spirochaetisodalis]|uniref:YibE/F family protein n=1 Tax=Halodesulfovibrio spirochaetisodalis TaxID=1560234 RepID=A0A1B7XCM3_9BACT|nr:YibE/F family protein [Halodesulfovibrio spirochaetisodalis]OBQ51706.1 YibE/F family protein [Halodesulfovibrio spirochaetisodalis]